MPATCDTEFTFKGTTSGYQVFDRDGTYLGTVRKGRRDWLSLLHEEQEAASRPTRDAAARRLAAAWRARRAHEADNKPAPIPAGFEPVDVTDLTPGDIVRPAHRLTAEGGVRTWTAVDRMVRAVEVGSHGNGGFVRFVRLDADDHFAFLISNFGWRQYVRRIADGA